MTAVIMPSLSLDRLGGALISFARRTPMAYRPGGHVCRAGWQRAGRPSGRGASTVRWTPGPPPARASPRSSRPEASLATGEPRHELRTQPGRRSEGSMPLHTQVDPSSQDDELDVNPVYVQEFGAEIPRYRLPVHGILPRTALQVIRDELILDGNARLNLATFVTTWMEPEAETLMAECAAKNMIDKDEYPQTAELEKRCVNILGNLWNAPADSAATGCSTTGSSEACMLGAMALLWRWRARRRAAGKDTARPNLVMASNVQVCWEKFCRYWGVEPKFVRVLSGHYHLGAAEAAALCDENTIGGVV